MDIQNEERDELERKADRYGEYVAKGLLAFKRPNWQQFALLFRLRTTADALYDYAGQDDAVYSLVRALRRASEVVEEDLYGK